MIDTVKFYPFTNGWVVPNILDNTKMPSSKYSIQELYLRLYRYCTSSELIIRNIENNGNNYIIFQSNCEVNDIVCTLSNTISAIEWNYHETLVNDLICNFIPESALSIRWHFDKLIYFYKCYGLSGIIKIINEKSKYMTDQAFYILITKFPNSMHTFHNYQIILNNLDKKFRLKAGINT